MKKFLLIILLFFSTLLAFAQEVRVVPKPQPTYIVYDGAEVLDAQQEKLLNDQLVSLDNTSSNQIAIATIKSLNGGNIEEVANATFRDWKIGNAKTNNGVLILVVTEDRKVRIEVGYGLEGAIPDGVAGSIIRNDMKPYFANNDYYHGLVKAVESLSKAAVGEYKTPRERGNTGSGSSGGFSILKFIIIGIIILIFIGRGGGGGRGRRGRMMSRSGSDVLTGMILGSMLGGGRSSGGGWSGGGFGGGGFGGFGGGSSGGGGASGSW